MDVDRKALSHIREVLKAHPRGMNVSEVAREIGMNRQSTAKYLSMMAMSGHVDVRAFGPSKVFYLSQRLPVSAMLSLSYDFIILLDRQLKILNVNDRFVEFANISRDDILYKSIDHLAFPLQFEPSIMPNIREALKGTESSIEAYYRKNGRGSYFNVKFIPMVLDDGDKGITVIFEDITERKRIEQAVRESEEKFRSVIEQSIDGIVLVDRRGTIVEYNRSLEEITGYGHEDIIGKHVWETPFFEQLLQNDRQSVEERKKIILQYIESDELPAKTLTEEKFIDRNGASIYVQVLSFKISTRKGYLLCAFIRDITERKRIEDAVAESEEKFRSVIEQSSDGMMLSDEEGTVIEYNGAMERITGVGRQEVLGRPLWEAHHIILGRDPEISKRLHDMRDRIRSYLKHGASNSLDRIVEIDIRAPDKTPKTIQFNHYNIKTKKGIIACSSIRDVTELKKAERALKDSEERYRVLAETAEDFIFIIDRDLKVLYLNELSARMMGMRPADVAGKHLQVLFPDETYAQMRDDALGVFETGRSMLDEIMIPSKDGNIWVSVNLTPIKEEGVVTSLMGISRDITQRKRMEDELREASDGLDRSVRERTSELEAANEALRKSEEKYRSLVESVSDIVWEMDSSFRFTYVSPRVRDLLGLEPGLILGKTSYDLMSPEEAARVKKIQQPVGLAKKPFELLECEFLHADGHRVPMEISGDPVLDEHGELLGYRGITRNISQRHKI